MTPYGLGWVKDLPDFRDAQMAFAVDEVAALPATHARLTGLPAIWNQGSIGSCAPHAVLRCFLYADLQDDGTQSEMLSRLMLYFATREMEGNVQWDSGTQIRDVIKVMAETGSCPESMWTYDISHFSAKPPQTCYEAAAKHELLKYLSVQPVLGQIKAALANNFPVVFGTPVYQSIFNAASGVIPIPGMFDKRVGGHALTFNGYWDDAKQLLGIDNSWSTGWGDRGMGYLPYWYVQNGLVSDCWALYSATPNAPTPPPFPPPGPQPIKLDTAELTASTFLKSKGHTVYLQPSGTSFRGAWT